MNRWALAVLAIAVVGCQQTQPAGSPFAAFQPTRLTGPSTGSYGMAKNGTMSASAAGAGVPGGSTVPPTWPSGGATTTPPAVTPAAPPASTPAVGGGLGGSSAVPPTLPPTGNDAYYNPGTSSTMSGAGAAGLAAQPLPAGAPLAGVSPSGSFGVGGSFASPGIGYGSPIAGFAPQGAVATVGYDQPIAGSNQPVAGVGQPTYYGATANAARASATGVAPASYGQPTYGQTYGQSTGNAATTRPSLPSASGTPSTWNGGASTTSSSGTMQWRSR
jgi:hypothetical protein